MQQLTLQHFPTFCRKCQFFYNVDAHYLEVLHVGVETRLNVTAYNCTYGVLQMPHTSVETLDAVHVHHLLV